MVKVLTYRVSKMSAATKKPNGIGSSTSNIADVKLNWDACVSDVMTLPFLDVSHLQAAGSPSYARFPGDVVH
jgi:hypothetical protein